jgi:hypothetical protein
MHAVLPILMSEQQKQQGPGDRGDDAGASAQEKAAAAAEAAERKRLQELEARAVAKAKATADAAFRPSPSILNAASPLVLLEQVDGASLTDYEARESIYVGRGVPISAGGGLTVPIHVATPGSVVEYAVELKQYDVGFGITAERDEGVTVVREVSRIDASMCPVTQKFLVGTTPCLIQLVFDNEYSWIREKSVSYKLTVTPPSKESLAAGRRRRAAACLKAVEDDLHTANQRFQTTRQQRSALEDKIAKLVAELEETKKASQVAQKELAWLQERRALRTEQQRLLKDRLQNGWKDEREEANVGGERNSSA